MRLPPAPAPTSYNRVRTFSTAPCLEVESSPPARRSPVTQSQLVTQFLFKSNHSAASLSITTSPICEVVVVTDTELFKTA
ncbi:hypothetical protein J6590_071343 [Homalodisca vitripennis]|nr:hypothetical protein J6590_071343 [Homalodisca vitripennis]